MALHSLTLVQLVEQVGLLGLNDMKAWKAGVVVSGSTTTFVDTINRDEGDDFFNTAVPKARIHILSTTDGAAPQGEERAISDWAGPSTCQGTVDPAFTAALGAGDKYVILSEYIWDELVAVINAAIDEVAGELLVPKVDETLMTAASAYEYILPSGFVWLHAVSPADDDGTFPEPIPADQWKIVHTDPPRLHLLRYPTTEMPSEVYVGGLWADNSITAGRLIRVEGFAAQARLVEDTDICNLDPTFVVERAAELLHAKRVRRSDDEPEGHATQAALHKAKADARRAWLLARFQLPPNSKRVEL